jgi:hypothetical protein
MCEAKPQVGSDWLISSSKLQPYLELCRFTQASLKIKVARWKVSRQFDLSRTDTSPQLSVTVTPEPLTR